MKFNILDYNPLEVRKLKSMDKNSKEYKKLYKNLRFMCRLNFTSMINRNDLNDELFNTKKYKKYKYISYSLFIIDIPLVTLLLSNKYLDYNINFIELIKLVYPELLPCTIAYIIGLIYAIKMKKLRDRFINKLISQSKIKCPHFSDELVSKVAYAYPFTTNNLNIMKNKEKCGCINCLTIFSSDEIKEHNSISVICPYCNKENIIAESSGYPITDEFLSEMKEYWIDSIN
ncbi:MAG: hypothetical protein Q8900_08075 [Bacillota bacterium]|nr:hypothetical protein [Bacillota bacterium]